MKEEETEADSIVHCLDKTKKTLQVLHKHVNVEITTGTEYKFLNR